MSHHETLWAACRILEADYEPYGKTERDGPDCSGGCKFFYPLKSKGREAIGMDWGACANPISLRNGLLTFEHQGCAHFEAS
jgi:hypothetical protein